MAMKEDACWYVSCAIMIGWWRVVLKRWWRSVEDEYLMFFLMQPIMKDGNTLLSMGYPLSSCSPCRTKRWGDGSFGVSGCRSSIGSMNMRCKLQGWRGRIGGQENQLVGGWYLDIEDYTGAYYYGYLKPLWSSDFWLVIPLYAFG
jgi:hypothetical protein